MHHYVSNTWCESYIHFLVFDTGERNIYIWGKMRQGIHFLPFKNYN